MPLTTEPKAPETEAEEDFIEPFQNSVNMNVPDPLQDDSRPSIETPEDAPHS